MKKFLVLSIVLFVLSSCRSDYKESYTLPVFDDSSFQLIRINPEEMNNFFSDLYTGIDSFRFIPLETQDEFLLGKIGQITPYKDKIYIWDQLTSAVFCFDRNGKYLFKVNNRGAGPEEYPTMDDMAVHPDDGSVYIQSAPLRTVYKYDNQGRFVGKIPCSVITSSFKPVGEDSLLCYSGKLPNAYFYQSTFPDQFRFSVIHNDRLLKKGLESRNNEALMNIPASPANNFFLYKDTLVLIDYLDGRVYTVDKNNELIPRYRLLIDTNNEQFSYDLKNPDIDYFSGNDYSRVINFVEAEKYIFIQYTYKGYVFLCIFNKATNNVYNVGLTWYDKKNNMGMPTDVEAADADRNCVYVPIEAGELKSIAERKSSDAIKQFTSRLNDADNPVLIQYFLKK